MLSMQDVHIVKLSRMRVASVRAFGSEPESLAWKALEDWAKEKSLPIKSEAHPVYGFNNPSPKQGDLEYGYELWIAIGPEVTSDGDATVKEFGGGLYAVARHYWQEPCGQDVPRGWMNLNTWLETSGYQMGSHQWLEKPFEDDKGSGLDLYLPIQQRLHQPRIDRRKLH
jgi:DNA gyrase inhibitor GyrI